MLKEPAKPTEHELEDKGKEEDNYFKDSQQLLDLYASLEEQNLFLIQNLQETEEGNVFYGTAHRDYMSYTVLDKTRTKLAETVMKMDAESLALQTQIGRLKRQRQQRLQHHKQGKSFRPFQPSKLGCTNNPVDWEDLEHKVPL